MNPQIGLLSSRLGQGPTVRKEAADPAHRVPVPILALRVRAVVGLVYVALAQVAFDHGLVLAQAGPFAALARVGRDGGGQPPARVGRAPADRGRQRHPEAEVLARTSALRATELEIIQRLGRAVESRDEETGDHIERIAELSHRLARAAGMSEDEAELLRRASAMHDVGKIAIPDHILRKPDPLSAEERAEMQRHTEVGGDLLAGSRSPVVQLGEIIARTHHERWDGTGYPNGLAGREIPLPGRICVVWDVYDALTSARPYKPAWPVEAAREELRTLRGQHLDPWLVDLFLEVVVPAEPHSASVV
jgi:HD-GYP domain-containing protein (c-di-GMP phosphodiesterase class II)